MATIETSVDVDAPVPVVYERWTRFEDFPRFMEGVEEVRRVDERTLHWIAEIGGQRREWQARITEEIPDQRIAWTSTSGEKNGGAVSFQRLEDVRTRVTVQMEYDPEDLIGKVGDILGFVTRRLEADLERFKRAVEEPDARSRAREDHPSRGAER